MNLPTFGERTPQGRRYEPEYLGPIYLLGPDHIEEAFVEYGPRREPELRAVRGAQGHSDEYGCGLDGFAVDDKPGLVAPEVPEQQPDRPQVPSCPPETSRSLGDSGRDLGVEADTEAVVERDPVDFSRVDDANSPSDEYLQRPPEACAHAEGLDVVIAATGGQQAHDTVRSRTRGRHFVHRPISTHSHHRCLLGQTAYDAASVASTFCDVPDLPQPSFLEKLRDERPHPARPLPAVGLKTRCMSPPVKLTAGKYQNRRLMTWQDVRSGSTRGIK